MQKEPKTLKRLPLLEALCCSVVIQFICDVVELFDHVTKQLMSNPTKPTKPTEPTKPSRVDKI